MIAILFSQNYIQHCKHDEWFMMDVCIWSVLLPFIYIFFFVLFSRNARDLSRPLCYTEFMVLWCKCKYYAKLCSPIAKWMEQMQTVIKFDFWLLFKSVIVSWFLFSHFLFLICPYLTTYTRNDFHSMWNVKSYNRMDQGLEQIKWSKKISAVPVAQYLFEQIFTFSRIFTEMSSCPQSTSSHQKHFKPLCTYFTSLTFN